MAYWWGRRHASTPSPRRSKEGTKDAAHKHADDRADGPVVVDDRRPVEGVPADRVLALRVALDDLGLLLARAVGDNFRALGHLPHDLISNNVDGELRVAERVRRALHRDLSEHVISRPSSTSHAVEQKRSQGAAKVDFHADRDQRRPQRLGDLAAGVEHLHDDLAHARVLALGVEHLIQ